MKTKLFSILFSLPLFLFAQKKILHSAKPETTLSGACYASSTKADLDANNVRAMILGSADMWWDLANAQYEIPKGSGLHSIYAGSLWIGAIDNLGQLRVAAQTYRQTGNDFWPGPVDTATHVASDSACLKYNRVWKVNRFMVEEFIQRYNDPSYTIPKDILEWPGNGDQSKGEAHYLAPYFDKNGDGKYNAHDGDYPGYDFTGNQNCQYNLLGDQTLWWIFNDVCGAHGETGGAPLGLEIQAQAFGFQTNDEINDATFYQYKVINRSTLTLDSMYWGQWVDSDLGCYTDDFVGCDVKRGLGYTYNGDNDDDVNCSSPGYGLHPPAIGCDFLGGPLADANDGIDNDRDSIIDEPGERIMMSDFLYYNNSNSVPNANPSGPRWFYNYLKSTWGDGTHVVYNGKDGYPASAPGPNCHFMYPGNSDPYGWGTNGIPQSPWDEFSAGNTPQDRHLNMSAGPFTMQPGAVQYITEGIIWARDTAGDNLAGIVAMQKADDKAQLLFDNCFTMPCYPPHANINSSINYLDVLFAYYGQSTSVNWDFGDGNTSTQKFPSHTYAASGTYNVCLKVTNACGTDSICKAVTVANIPPPPWGVRLKRIEGNGNAGQNLDWLQQNYDSILASPQHRVVEPVYEYMKGPVNVGVFDTTLLPKNKFIIKFDGVTASAKWKMYRIGYTDTAFADSSIGTGYKQMIPLWGLYVQGWQSKNPGDFGSINNGFIEATMNFSDTTKKWLSGLTDTDLPSYDNWIRSGNNAISGYLTYTGVDDNLVYEHVLNGTWSPYRLVACTSIPLNYAGYYTGPGFKSNSMSYAAMNLLASVDVIITSDKSKWTRCVVFEMCEDSTYSSNTSTISTKARKLDFRRASSVDKNGVANYPSTDNNDFPSGMGWFPGYAVNLETGERLNISFGENSALVNENGNDMIWNPTKNKYATTYNLPWDTVNKPVFGGEHYIYVFGHNKSNTPPSVIPIDTLNIPRYDGGVRAKQLLSMGNNLPSDNIKREVFADAMWVNIPLLAQGQTLLSSDATIRLRVTKQYQKGYSSALYRNGNTYIYTDTCSTPQNQNFPMYGFDGNNFGLSVSVADEIKDVSFFPNPFYNSAILKFDNKESKSNDLKIFDMQGKVVREYKNLTGQSVTVERGSLNSGIYFYSLTAEGAKRAVGKFVVMSKE